MIEQAWVRVAREALGPEARVVPQQWLAHTTALGSPRMIAGAWTSSYMAPLASVKPFAAMSRWFRLCAGMAARSHALLSTMVPCSQARAGARKRATLSLLALAHSGSSSSPVKSAGALVPRRSTLFAAWCASGRSAPLRHCAALLPLRGSAGGGASSA
ncbi:MAG: hypothetical protein NXI12_15505 [Alphaproteobacteria bacterium]|nr:hypothetical protein [Alphaproteobacteria bacterium]